MACEQETSEVFRWLKALSPSIKLERFSPHFEARGFKSKRSLAFVKADDLDVFFPSPNKLLLAERRLLEAELDKIKSSDDKQTQPKRPESARKLQYEASHMPRSTSSFVQASQPTCDSNVSGASSSHSLADGMSALDRKALEHNENLQLLNAQVESVKQHLESKQKTMENLLDSSVGRRGKLCSTCHQPGHNKARCKATPCTNVKRCKIPDKHPENQNEIREIQKELKELINKYDKAKSDHDIFVAARQRVKSSFFAVIRPRLRQQNLAKYVDRSILDKDLQILQRALANKVPIDETNDWRLPYVIEEYKRGIEYMYHPQSAQLQSTASHQAYSSSTSTSPSSYHDTVQGQQADNSFYYF